MEPHILLHCSVVPRRDDQSGIFGTQKELKLPVLLQRGAASNLFYICSRIREGLPSLIPTLFAVAVEALDQGTDGACKRGLSLFGRTTLAPCKADRFNISGTLFHCNVRRREPLQPVSQDEAQLTRVKANGSTLTIPNLHSPRNFVRRKSAKFSYACSKLSCGVYSQRAERLHQVNCCRDPCRTGHPPSPIILPLGYPPPRQGNNKGFSHHDAPSDVLLAQLAATCQSYGESNYWIVRTEPIYKSPGPAPESDTFNHLHSFFNSSNIRLASKET
jgi:hypothetical protein